MALVIVDLRMAIQVQSFLDRLATVGAAKVLSMQVLMPLLLPQAASAMNSVINWLM